jgi:hypothetical protein
LSLAHDYDPGAVPADRNENGRLALGFQSGLQPIQLANEINGS